MNKKTILKHINSMNGEELFLELIHMLNEKAKTIDGIRLGYCRCHTSDVDGKYKVGEVFNVHCMEGGGKDFFDAYSVFGENPLRLISFDCPDNFNELFEEISKEKYEQVIIEKRFDL